MISKNLKQADKLLFQLGKRIEILDKIRWPISMKERFLKNWCKNTPIIPVVKYKRVDYSKEKAVIKDIIRLSKEKNQLAAYVKETALSYRLAIDMIEQRGKPAFLKRSIELYHTPRDPFRAHDNHNALEVAKKILKEINSYDIQTLVPKESYCVLPKTVKRRIEGEVRKRFPDWKFEVKIDSKLQAKAQANINRMRIREDCCFADYDSAQLLQHEVFVHALTLRNGRKQKIKSLGLSSPRTTITQEGLAVFSEFITGTIDIVRLSRISARVVAIDMALRGANFIEVFKFFLKQGQNLEESYYSTARVFRGGNPNGGLAFTKDAVYLRGLVEVHNFFLDSLKNSLYDYTKYLFAGRMNVQDVASLEPSFLLGVLKKPVYEPEWLKEPSLILAFLLSSHIMNTLGINQPKRKHGNR